MYYCVKKKKLVSVTMSTLMERAPILPGKYRSNCRNHGFGVESAILEP